MHVYQVLLRSKKPVDLKLSSAKLKGALAELKGNAVFESLATQRSKARPPPAIKIECPDVEGDFGSDVEVAAPSSKRARPARRPAAPRPRAPSPSSSSSAEEPDSDRSHGEGIAGELFCLGFVSFYGLTPTVTFNGLTSRRLLHLLF